MSETFDWVIEQVRGIEGGFVDDPDDPGGETKYGISKRRYPEVEIAALTWEQAVELYRLDFWNPLYERIGNRLLALKLFELTINLPHGDTRPYYGTDMRGVRLVQEAINALRDRSVERGASSVQSHAPGAGRITQDAGRVTVDGRFGPQTMMALRLDRPGCLLAAIRVEQCRYYLELADRRQDLRSFLRGWIRRAVS